jgi:hypothetical protein
VSSVWRNFFFYVPQATPSLVDDAAQDPLIGGQVYLNNALLCDTNPEGFTSTQTLCGVADDSWRPGAIATGRGTFVIRRDRRAPTTTRWLNFRYRNVSLPRGFFGLRPTGKRTASCRSGGGRWRVGPYGFNTAHSGE